MRRLTFLMLIILLAPVIGGAARAQPEQTPAEMRTEIDLLRQRIAQLEAQLEEAQRRAERLAGEVETLKRQLAERPKPEQGAEPAEDELEVPVDQPLEREPTPEDWSKSPDALFDAMARSYEAALGQEPRDNRAQEQRYLTLVTKWLRGAEREFRDDVIWTVRVTRVLERPDHGADVMMQVVNPDTGKAWSEPFTMTVDRYHRELLQRNPSLHYWGIAGTLSAEPGMNRERETPGFFLHPLLIGPYAEFGYEFKIRRMEPVTLQRAPAKDAENGEPAAPDASDANTDYSSANSQTVTGSR